MPRSQTARGLGPDEEPLFSRQIGQRKLVRIQKSSRDGAFESFGVPGIGLVRDGDVAPERCLHRSQNVSTAAAGAQKEDMHVTPACSCRAEAPKRRRRL